MLFPLALGFSSLTFNPNSIIPNPFPTSGQNPMLAGRLCPEKLGKKPDGSVIYSQLKYSQRWVQVRTRSGSLNLRATPNGRVIGAIPSGWQVIVGRYDPSRKWAYVYPKFGDGSGYLFWSAPKFRSSGWVSADFLVPLGEACAKPLDMALVPHLQIAATTQPEVRESLEDALLAWISQL
jgi:hypothetical protein